MRIAISDSKLLSTNVSQLISNARNFFIKYKCRYFLVSIRCLVIFYTISIKKYTVLFFWQPRNFLINLTSHVSIFKLSVIKLNIIWNNTNFIWLPCSYIRERDIHKHKKISNWSPQLILNWPLLLFRNYDNFLSYHSSYYCRAHFKWLLFYLIRIRSHMQSAINHT